MLMAQNHAFFPAKALKIVAISSKHFGGKIALYSNGVFGLCNNACMWRRMACFLVYLSKERELEDKAAPVYPSSQ